MNFNRDIFESKSSENDDFTEFSDDDALYNNQDESEEGYKRKMKNAKMCFVKKSDGTNNRKRSKSHEK